MPFKVNIKKLSVAITLPLLFLTACEVGRTTSTIGDNSEDSIGGGAEVVYLFDNGTDVFGNLSAVNPVTTTGPGRSYADNGCQSQYDSMAVTWGISCNHVKAVLSFAGDSIKDMPDNQDVPEDVSVETIDGGVMANDWDDFMDGFNGVPSGTGFSGYSSGTFWTGSDSDGDTDAANNCTDFSVGSSGNAQYMDSTLSLAPWSIGTDSCGNTRPYLCICWDE